MDFTVREIVTRDHLLFWSSWMRLAQARGSTLTGSATTPFQPAGSPLLTGVSLYRSLWRTFAKSTARRRSSVLNCYPSRAQHATAATRLVRPARQRRLHALPPKSTLSRQPIKKIRPTRQIKPAGRTKLARRAKPTRSTKSLMRRKTRS